MKHKRLGVQSCSREEKKKMGQLGQKEILSKFPVVHPKTLCAMHFFTFNIFNRPFQMGAWSCITSYYSPLRGSHCHILDTVNPAMGMMLCSSMLAFEKVYRNTAIHNLSINRTERYTHTNNYILKGHIFFDISFANKSETDSNIWFNK